MKDGRLQIDSWVTALNCYCYPVKLHCYEHRHTFPGYFNKLIKGDRDSTVEFENYFRNNAQQSIEVYLEVVFWKLFSNKQFWENASRIINNVLRRNVKPESLYAAIKRFTEQPSVQNLRDFRDLLGIGSEVLAVPLTFPAFVNPEKYPMIDNHVARWVNDHHREHSRERVELTPFSLAYTSLRDNDFQNYVNWVNWCCDTAAILSEREGTYWRARDVEMAVFTVARGNIRNLELGVL